MSTTTSETKSWSLGKTGCEKWIIIADSSNGNIDFRSPGRGIVYIRPDEQAEFQIAYDAARAWLAEQSWIVPDTFEKTADE